MTFFFFFKQIALMLLENGADPNATDKLQSTPLHRASAKGNYRLIQLLLKQSASTNIQDSEGNTPLYVLPHSFTKRFRVQPQRNISQKVWILCKLENRTKSTYHLLKFRFFLDIYVEVEFDAINMIQKSLDQQSCVKVACGQKCEGHPIWHYGGTSEGLDSISVPY